MDGGTVTNWLHDTIGDFESTRSLAGRARTRRWHSFAERFPSISEMRVIDLGGTPESWHLAPVRPSAVTIVNLLPLTSDESAVDVVQADACDLPAGLRRERFDLVYSNSLIEHVGGHSQRQRLAEAIDALAERHWVQTPYRYFPVEPHWVFPGMQWFPYEARVQISLRWNRGNVHTYTRQDAQNAVDQVDLLSISQMRRYFPNSSIWHERFAGLVKSVVAVRD
jgi:hypothetical protein